MKEVIMDKKVIELFAGVGGFRVGLNRIESFDEDGHAIEKGANLTIEFFIKFTTSTGKPGKSGNR